MIIDFLDNVLAKTAIAAGEAIDSLDKRTNNKDDEELKNLLNQADSSDLSILVDHITDNGKGRSSLSSESCKRLISAKNNNDFTSDIKHLIYREIGWIQPVSATSPSNTSSGVLNPKIFLGLVLSCSAILFNCSCE